MLYSTDHTGAKPKKLVAVESEIPETELIFMSMDEYSIEKAYDELQKKLLELMNENSQKIELTREQTELFEVCSNVFCLYCLISTHKLHIKFGIYCLLLNIVWYNKDNLLLKGWNSYWSQQIQAVQNAVSGSSNRLTYIIILATR